LKERRPRQKSNAPDEESGRIELHALARRPGGSDPACHHWRRSPWPHCRSSRSRTRLAAFGAPPDPGSQPTRLRCASFGCA